MLNIWFFTININKNKVITVKIVVVFWVYTQSSVLVSSDVSEERNVLIFSVSYFVGGEKFSVIYEGVI